MASTVAPITPVIFENVLPPSQPSLDSAFSTPVPTPISAPRQTRPAASDSTRRLFASVGSSIALAPEAMSPTPARPTPTARSICPGTVDFSKPLISPSSWSTVCRRLTRLCVSSPSLGSAPFSIASTALFICSGDTPISLAKRESRMLASASLAFWMLAGSLRSSPSSRPSTLDLT